MQFAFGRKLFAFGLVLGVFIVLIFGKKREAVAMMLRASRYTDGKSYKALLRKHLTMIKEQSPKLLPEPVGLHVLDQRCVVLAEPRIDRGTILRKGVLLVSFTETSGLLFASVDWPHIYKLFHLVLEPSSSGYADPSLLCWLNYPEPVIVQATEKNDRVLLRSLNANLIPVPYGAGDWIDPDCFFPIAVEQGVPYDAISVSNYGWWKRNHAYIRAIGRAAREIRNYRAVLVLAGLGRTPRTAKRLMDLIRAYQVQANLTVIDGLGREELNRLYATSGVMVFPPWKEGSSRVIFEAMCADTPVVMLRRNVGVNKDYLNAKTGAIVAERELGQTLIRLHREDFRASPRAWFLENLGPWNTTVKLARDLANAFPEEGWRPDELLVKGNVPEPRILAPEQTSRPLSYWLEQA